MTGRDFAGFIQRLEGGGTFPKGRHARVIRPRYPRVIAGVCSGVAEYFGWEASVLRVLVVLLAIASSGLVALGYLVAWVVLPEGQYALAGSASNRSAAS